MRPYSIILHSASPFGFLPLGIPRFSQNDSSCDHRTEARGSFGTSIHFACEHKLSKAYFGVYDDEGFFVATEYRYSTTSNMYVLHQASKASGPSFPQCFVTGIGMSMRFMHLRATDVGRCFPCLTFLHCLSCLYLRVCRQTHVYCNRYPIALVLPADKRDERI